MPYVLPFNYQVAGFQSVPCFYITSRCVLTFPHCDNKPRQNNLLKGGEFTLAYGFRGSCLSLWKGMAEQRAAPIGGQEAKGHPSSPPICRMALLTSAVGASWLVNPLWKNLTSLLGVSQHNQGDKMNSPKPCL